MWSVSPPRALLDTTRVQIALLNRCLCSSRSPFVRPRSVEKIHGLGQLDAFEQQKLKELQVHKENGGCLLKAPLRLI